MSNIQPASWRAIESLVEHGHMSVNGTTLHYVQAGPREAPPLVLLHGFPESWIMWRRVIPELARRYRVVAADLRGYGDSANPPALVLWGERGNLSGQPVLDIWRAVTADARRGDP